MTTQTQSIIDNSTMIARCGNGNQEGCGDLYRHGTTLYRHCQGKFFTTENGGAAVTVRREPKWMTMPEAIEWIATVAIDPVTGYGYSAEQAKIMAHGDNAGPGMRE